MILYRQLITTLILFLRRKLSSSDGNPSTHLNLFIDIIYLIHIQITSLKGESSSQACRSYMIVNVIVKDRQNFFFHFMIPPSAGGLPGQFVLA